MEIITFLSAENSLNDLHRLKFPHHTRINALW